VRVSRWTASLPQYRPGHLDRVATLEADLAEAAPGLAAAGAWARGIGIPACIRAGRAAARGLLAVR
jgi:protoporphyrinogen/coproporphyrinogen III oxidase